MRFRVAWPTNSVGEGINRPQGKRTPTLGQANEAVFWQLHFLRRGETGVEVHFHLSHRTRRGGENLLCLSQSWCAFALQSSQDERLFSVPATTLRALAREIEEKLDIQTLRVVGDGEMKVSRIALSPGCPGFGTHRHLSQSRAVDAGHDSRRIFQRRVLVTAQFVARLVNAELSVALRQLDRKSRSVRET